MTTDPHVAGYDRAAASRLLAQLATPGLFGELGEQVLGARRTIVHRAAPLTPAPGSHLTVAQHGYLDSYMQPCPAGQVTSAADRVTWTDSQGTPNVAHCGPGGWGPVVPVAAREATLALWRALEADVGFAARAEALDDGERALLAATTTDGEPSEIFRIGVEAAARALVQHAYLADPAVHATPGDFARALRDGGVFAVAASTWYWELQASTYRRGMIPVRLETGPDGGLRYDAASIAVLRDMKDATIATARAVMRRATTEEGLTVPEAVQLYHHDRDEIAKQYALLPAGEQPRCLAVMPHDLDGTRFSVLPGVVDAFVEVFARTVGLIDLVDVGDGPDRPLTDPADHVFHVPDMNCAHCKRTITKALTGLGIPVEEVDLVGKRVVARFATAAVRERGLDAVRDAGYTVVPPGEGVA